jgi:hypothetical protein
MKSLFVQMGIVAFALLGWVVYDHWGQWTAQSTAAVKSIATTVVKSSLPTEASTPTTTTVYKWQDAQGRWQFSNTPPEDQKSVSSETIRSDQNVVPRPPVPLPVAASAQENKPKGVFSHFAEDVNQARDIQSSANNRQADMDRQLENALR